MQRAGGQVIYSDEQLEQLATDTATWLGRGNALVSEILARAFRHDRAEKFAREGFCRRLGYLDHALRRLEDIYPPDFSVQSRARVRDAELLLQAFVMNVFGAIDNLAWVWALERGVKNRNGKDLLRTELVFDGPRSGPLLASLTPAVANAVAEAEEWFKVIGAYRHGVAHQIPIYIPRQYTAENMAILSRLSVAVDEAIAAGDRQTVFRLIDEKNNVGRYGSLMALSGEHPPMRLHPQLTCDFATVVQLGEAVFTDLDM